MLLFELEDLIFKNDTVIVIEIDSMMFNVVYEAGNIYWGLVPKTGTMNKINATRDKNGRSHIMRRLIPMLKEAIGLLLERNDVRNASIIGRTKKSQELYRSWINDFPGYTGSITGWRVWGDGINLTKKQS